MGATNGNDKHNRALSALMSAALALPGISGAATPVTKVHTDYRFNYYTEGDIPAAKLSGGSHSRYEIRSHLLDVQAPLPFRLLPEGIYGDIEANLVHESMSGASPWYVKPGAGTHKQPVQIMSGATIHETRNKISSKVNLYHNANRLGLIAGYSKENDYESLSFGVEGEIDFNQGLTTLQGGVGYDNDTVEPTLDPPQPQPRVHHKTLHQWTVYAGITQVLDRHSVIQTSVSFSQANGYLSDPYKLAFVDGELERDTRPDQHRRFTWLTRYNHYFEWSGSALHVSYRFYDDDWGTSAHTLELGVIQPLGRKWQITPRIRYYSQSGANFYAPYFPTVPDNFLYSSDYRLSPFGAISWRLDVTRYIGAWELNLAYERYTSKGSLAIKHVSTENPGLVDFQVVSVSIKATFD